MKGRRQCGREGGRQCGREGRGEEQGRDRGGGTIFCYYKQLQLVFLSLLRY